MKHVRHTLQLLPVGCLALLCMAAGGPHGTVTSDANPALIGEEFALTLTLDDLTPNMNLAVGFLRIDHNGETMEVANVYTSSGTGHVNVVSPLMASEGIFSDGECVEVYAFVRSSPPFSFNLNTDTITLCPAFESSTAADTASRILPVFRASVEAIAPGTATPTGEVEFYVGNKKVCTGELDESGDASCSSLTQVLSLYSHYTARYTGDGVYLASEDQGSFSPL